MKAKKVLVKGLVVSLSLFACFGVSTSASAAEITFRGIPWGSDIGAVEDALPENGYFYANGDAYIPYWESCATWDEMLFGQTAYPSGWTGLASYYDGQKVAGYNISQIQTWSHYGLEGNSVLRSEDDSKFYAAQYTFDVVDISGAYEDIKQKMTDLYGPCIENVEISSGGIYGIDGMDKYEATAKVAEWLGDNGGQARLVMECNTLGPENYTHHYLILYYGKADSTAEIERVVECVEAEAISEENANRTDDTNGL